MLYSPGIAIFVYCHIEFDIILYVSDPRIVFYRLSLSFRYPGCYSWYQMKDIFNCTSMTGNQQLFRLARLLVKADNYVAVCHKSSANSTDVNKNDNTQQNFKHFLG